MSRITVTDVNALDVAEVVLTHIGEPAHFTRIGAEASTLGYVYEGAKQGGDLGTFLRVAMWNDTLGDEKAAKSRFVRCANRVYRLRATEVAATFDSKALVPRKGRVVAAPANPGEAASPTTTLRAIANRREPVAALVAIALQKPIESRGDAAVDADTNAENAAAQTAALEDMRRVADETRRKIAEHDVQRGRDRKPAAA